MAWGMHGGLQGMEGLASRLEARDIYEGPGPEPSAVRTVRNPHKDVEQARLNVEEANKQRAQDAKDWSLGMYEFMNSPLGKWMGEQGLIEKDFDEFNKQGWMDNIFDTGFITDVPTRSRVSYYLDDNTPPIQGGLFSGPAPHRAEGRDF